MLNSSTYPDPRILIPKSKTGFFFFFFFLPKQKKKKRKFQPISSSPRAQLVCLVKGEGRSCVGDSACCSTLECGALCKALSLSSFAPLFSLRRFHLLNYATHLIPCRNLKSERLEQGTQSLNSIIFGRTYPKAWSRVSTPLLPTQIQISNFS